MVEPWPDRPLNSYASLPTTKAQQVCYPQPEASDFIFDGKDLKHPLLP